MGGRHLNFSASLLKLFIPLLLHTLLSGQIQFKLTVKQNYWSWVSTKCSLKIRSL